MLYVTLRPNWFVLNTTHGSPCVNTTQHAGKSITLGGLITALLGEVTNGNADGPSTHNPRPAKRYTT